MHLRVGMDLLPNWPSAEQESSQRDKQYVVGKAGCASHLAPGMESLLHPGLIGKGAKLPSCRKGRTGQCLWQCGAVPPGLLRSRLGGPWRPPLTSCPAPACTQPLPVPCCCPPAPGKGHRACKQEAGKLWGRTVGLQEKPAGSGGCRAVT